MGLFLCQAEEIKQSTGETMQDTKENTESWTEWAKEKLTGTLGAKQEGAKQTGQDVMDKAKDGSVKTKDTVTDTASGASNLASEKAGEAANFSYSELGESEVDNLEHDEEIQVDRKIAEDEEDSAESEVDDPEQEDAQVDRLDGVANMVNESEVKKLRDEIERLKEENRIQKEQLMQKDEEKREVIRQLSLSMEILKENARLCKRRTASAKES